MKGLGDLNISMSAIASLLMNTAMLGKKPKIEDIRKAIPPEALKKFGTPYVEGLYLDFMRMKEKRRQMLGLEENQYTMVWVFAPDQQSDKLCLRVMDMYGGQYHDFLIIPFDEKAVSLAVQKLYVEGDLDGYYELLIENYSPSPKAAELAEKAGVSE